MLCASSAWSSSFCSSVRRLGSGAGAGPPPMAPAARTARVSPRNLAQTRPRPPAAGYSRRGAPPPTVGCAAAGCGDPPALVESGLISAFPLSTFLCGNPQIFAGVDSTACRSLSAFRPAFKTLGGRLRKLLATADRQQCAPRWAWRCVRCWLRLQLPFLGALPSLPHSRRTRSRCVQSAVPTRACMRARGVHGGH